MTGLVAREINVSLFNSKFSTQLTPSDFKSAESLDASHEVVPCPACHLVARRFESLRTLSLQHLLAFQNPDGLLLSAPIGRLLRSLPRASRRTHNRNHSDSAGSRARTLFPSRRSIHQTLQSAEPRFPSPDGVLLFHDSLRSCFGLGVSRIIGALFELFGHNSGVILPDQITTFDVVLLNTGSSLSRLANRQIPRGKRENRGTARRARRCGFAAGKSRVDAGAADLLRRPG